MVEFGLVIVIYLVFIFGLLSLIWWSTSAFFAQQMAHETARKYAVTANKQEAEQLGKAYLERWAAIFIEPEKTKITVEKKDSTMAKSTVTVKPRFSIITLDDYDIGTITRYSQSPFEHFIRNPGEYKK